MDEPARLACPQCELVYRLKKLTPGRAYSCKNCGGPLLPAEAVATGGEGGASVLAERASAIYDNAADVARGRAAMAAGQAPESDLSRLPKMIEQLIQRIDAVKGLEIGEDEESPAVRLIAMNERLENELREFAEAVAGRLNELDERVGSGLGGEVRRGLDELDEKVAATLDGSARDMQEKVAAALDGNARDMHEKVAAALDGNARDLQEKVAAALDGNTRDMHETLALRLGELETRLEDLSEKTVVSSGNLDGLKDVLARQQESLANALGEHREAQRRELDSLRDGQRQELAALREAQKKHVDALLAPLESQAGNTTIEVDIDELADRLVAGVRGHGQVLDADSGSAVDAMARLADELVKEQSANTARLDRLAEEIHAATAGISKLEEWRGELPERVADEIGQTVEARVVGPISDTLTRQAPALLAEFHDNKLVDLVSRSVREAQRPLLREILAGGRRGVPVWLFASVLLPLMLILGYLFLPGVTDRERRDMTEEGLIRTEESLARAEERLARIEAGMSPIASIEDLVFDTHNEALAHAHNVGRLEEKIRSLEKEIADRDVSINNYKDALQTQVRRLRAYEMRLAQLGVSPDTVGE